MLTIVGMFNKPTTVFASRELSLTPAQLGTPKVDRLELKDGGLVISFAAARGEVKYQAKDNTQGGMLQVETELGLNITHTITLAPGIFYFLDPNLKNAVRLGNGIVSRAKSVLLCIRANDSARRRYSHGLRWQGQSAGR